jgi:cysteinyl-tRNA synthetase
MPVPFCSTLEVLEKMHPLVVYNSLTRTKVRFIPSDPKRVTWYQCGPTVYAESHLGHARTYVSLDVIRRITQDYLGYKVLLCQNITDIDDKIIIRSSERGMPFRELASKYETEFLEDMSMLGIQTPDMMTRVSEYMNEIIEYVQRLESKGFAYCSNGSVYFDTEAFEKAGHTYGKLMPEQIGNAELLAEGEGALADKDGKRKAHDFALWKKTKDHTDDGIIEPSWDSPWGKGRPGWHIECSAMSHAYLGENFDIHGGGVDLLFPHHSNEIAQSKCAFDNSSYAHYWVHNGTLTVNKNKMSKSLGNFITVDALRDDNISGEALRWFLLSANYHKPLDYSAKAIDDCQSCIDYLYRTMRLNGQNSLNGQNGLASLNWQDLPEDFTAPLLDNMNSPKALSFLLELAKKINKASNEHKVLDADIVILKSCANFLGLLNHNADVNFDRIADVTHHPEIDALIQERIIAKKTNNWYKADEIRDLLTAKGVILEDSKNGSTSWRFKVAKTDKS